MENLKIDDDFKNLLPDLTSEEYTGLERDIVKHGVLNPIIIWNGIIVDGHNRLRYGLLFDESRLRIFVLL